MRSTRSNTIPSTCFIFGVPPEILQYMMSSMSTSSLVSLAVCCKRLRDLASPILLRSVKVVTNRKDNFIPLLRLATNAEKSSRLRHLSLVDGKPKNSIERDKAGSNNLASVLPTFINLTSLEIPFPFLSNDLFHLIYSHASITTLKICTPVERWRTNDLATRDRTPLPPRPLPLLVPELEVGLYIGKDDYYQLGNLLDFFNFHGVVVPEIKLHNHITGPAGAFGSAGSLPGRLESSIIVPHLTSLHVTITEDHCPTSLQWLASIFNTTQTSLQEVHLAVGKYGDHSLPLFPIRSKSHRTPSSPLSPLSPSSPTSRSNPASPPHPLVARSSLAPPPATTG
ncbi:hypothetical protein BDY24DRAFT_400048 [Mrakia frigida]|uniref:uncharacterized protein n=1 Tax=Mrakia frigida TaxID=29902 RepID=UPI003FCC0791